MPLIFVMQLWAIGKTKFPFVRDGISEFQKRLQRYETFSYSEFPNIKHHAKLPPDLVKKGEAELILGRLGSKDLLILLDETGKSFDSIGFAQFIEQLQASGKRITWVIAGAYGAHHALKQRADHMVSLSSMTYSHQLIRCLFLEQLYRAFTIIRGESYHNP